VEHTEIAPLAKRLAEENNVDWRRLRGSGERGRVVERDVLEYLARVMAGDEELDPTPEPVPAGMESWPEDDVRAFERERRGEVVPPAFGTSTLDDEIFLLDGGADDLDDADLDEAALYLPDEHPAAGRASFGDAASAGERGTYGAADDDDLLVAGDERPYPPLEPSWRGEDVRAVPDVTDPEPVLTGGGTDSADVELLPDLFDDRPARPRWDDGPVFRDERHAAVDPTEGESARDRDAALRDAQGWSTAGDGPGRAVDADDPAPVFDWGSPAATQAADEAPSRAGGVPSGEFDADLLEAEPLELDDLDEPGLQHDGLGADEPAREPADLPAFDALAQEPDDERADVAAFDALAQEPADEPADVAASGAPAYEPAAPGQGDDVFDDVEVPRAADHQSVWASHAEDEDRPEPAFAAEEGASPYTDELDEPRVREAAEFDAVPLSGGEPTEPTTLPSAVRVPASGTAYAAPALGGIGLEQLPLVSHGAVWRRQVDLSNLVAAQADVARDLGLDEPVPAIAFLARAAAKALAGGGRVAIAHFDAESIHVTPFEAAERPFGEVVESLARLARAPTTMGGRADLIVADLSDLELDEAVLHLGAPVLAIGRVLIDSSTGGRRATLAVSGDALGRDAAKILARAADLLETPVRIVL
jgi:hypothetical protein